VSLNLFNLHNYSTMLNGARELDYSFICFDQVNGNHDNKKKKCLLRHDVDSDVSAALKIANIEYHLGIKSTFFLMTRSPFYNIFSRHNHRFIQEIISLGHSIGLHYDQGFDLNDGRPVSELINLEVTFLEKMFNCKISAVSFHQPSSIFLIDGVDTGDLVNTYDKDKLRNFKYISDSNRKFSPFIDLESEAKVKSVFSNFSSCSVQMLIHPMWWVYTDITTSAVWDKIIINNYNQSQAQIIETELAFGPSRKITIPEFK